MQPTANVNLWRQSWTLPMTQDSAQPRVRHSAAAQSSSLNKAVSSAARPRTGPRRRRQMRPASSLQRRGLAEASEIRPFAGVESGEAPRRSRRPTRPLSRDVVDAGDAVDAVDVDAAEKNSYVRTDCEPDH